jgi:hypothetical protein
VAIVVNEDNIPAVDMLMIEIDMGER